MTANLGAFDRAARLVVGVALIVIPLLNLFGNWESPVVAYTVMGVGAILALTAVFKFCPIYRLLGISTCKI